MRNFTPPTTSPWKSLQFLTRACPHAPLPLSPVVLPLALLLCLLLVLLRRLPLLKVPLPLVDVPSLFLDLRKDLHRCLAPRLGQRFLLFLRVHRPVPHLDFAASQSRLLCFLSCPIKALTCRRLSASFICTMAWRTCSNASLASAGSSGHLSGRTSRLSARYRAEMMD